MKRFGFFARMAAVVAAPIAMQAAKVTPAVDKFVPFETSSFGMVEGKLAPFAEHAPMFEVRLSGMTERGEYVDTIASYIENTDITAMAEPEVTSLVRSMYGNGGAITSTESFAKDFDRFEIWQWTSRTNGRVLFQGALHEGRVPAGWQNLDPHGWVASEGSEFAARIGAYRLHP